MIIDQICSNVMLLLGGFNANNMNMVSGSLINPVSTRSDRSQSLKVSYYRAGLEK